METQEKTNVNSAPLYIGNWMILSDQDMTALKHHVLSSAVMGTTFAGVIGWVSQPEVEFWMKALVLGGMLTGVQGLLVALSNVGILMFEWFWPRKGQVLSAIWSAYLSSHTYVLDNGSTVWIDGITTVVLSEGSDN